MSKQQAVAAEAGAAAGKLQRPKVKSVPSSGEGIDDNKNESASKEINKLKGEILVLKSKLAQSAQVLMQTQL